MLLAHFISGVVRVFVGAASTGDQALWMSTLLALGVLITIAVVTRCLVRLPCWAHAGISMNAFIKKVFAGEKGERAKVQREQAARRRRVIVDGGKAVERAEQDLQQVSKGRQQKGSAAATSGDRGRQKVEGGPEESAIATPPPPLPKEKEFTATSRRTPKDSGAVPRSVLRGFPEVDFLLTSPGQSYLLIGCRSKRKTSLYPQSNTTAFMERGKELQEKHFTDVNAVATTAVGLEQKAEIYSAHFSMDDTRLIVGERFTDNFLCFAVSGRTSVCLTHLWSMKLPDHRLVSSVPHWSVLGQDSILCIADQTTEVEVITRGAAGTAKAHKDKFKVGTALAWAVCDDCIALGGSFLREPRLSRVVQRAGSAGIALEPVAVFPNAEKLRVSALAFVTPGAPDFNTRSYAIAFMESGIGSIYDLATLSTRNMPQMVCTFEDTDYAGYRSDAPLRILTAVRGQAYHEVLLIALVRGPNLTVYEQSGKADSGSFQLVRVADMYDVQEGGPVKFAVFLQNGRGVATSGQSDGRHVRMFALPPPGPRA
ncbi:hypothetical protein LSCM1_03105 [Leishmania martiniquensis]|uniref:Uncharacterized protein n=1 Tax=Leishmania martiniquensis TaxID=1580590 RepID=A0A836HCF8_9TRYP|nr:hypothetical protein LSCM1_03105 [Leishmania martiniquensis]